MRSWLTLACVFALTGGALAQNPPKQPEPSKAGDDARRASDLLKGLGAEKPIVSTAPVTKLGHVRTSLFGIEAEGAKFVYVFDRSASMSEPKNLPIRAAKAELIRSLQPLGRTQQFYVIFYNQEPKVFQPGAESGKLIFANDKNKEAAESFIKSIQPEGGTRHYTALDTALKMRPDVIYLLTDGDAHDDLTADELERLEKLNGGITQIHVVQFTADFPTGDVLKKLPATSQGEFKTVPIEKLPAK
ncbi:MAG: VWA domain-containing protein [Pirellulales bacterium]